jgi:dCTP deaminase
MILSDVTIKKYKKKGSIKISPNFDEKNIRPTGIRLHFGDEILIPKPNQTIDISKPIDIKYRKIKINKNKGYLLKPNEFILGTTYESILLPKNLVGKLDGRSTIARLGILVHCSSDTIDGNYEQSRTIVLEIKNIGNFNILLKPQNPIGMLVLYKLTKKIKQKSQSQYENQLGVQPPNLKKQLR